MTWRYQATHRTIETPYGTEDVFEVREVYEGLNDDGGLTWTENAIAACSDSTKEELIEALQMMLADVQAYPVLELDA